MRNPDPQRYKYGAEKTRKRRGEQKQQGIPVRNAADKRKAVEAYRRRKRKTT